MKNLNTHLSKKAKSSIWTNRYFGYVILLFSLIPISSVIGQTTVFTDDFNRGAVVIPLGNGGTPSMTYTTATTSTGTGVLSTGAYSRSQQLSGSDYVANIVPANSTASQTAGRTFITAPLSTYSSPFVSTLSSNTGPITWTFNMRTNRTTALSGFAGSAYAAAVVLAATSSDFMTANGYAVVEAKGTTRNAISLVRFAGGLGATPTTIIGPSTDLATNNVNFFSVKVVYTPATNTWQLYVRDDASATVKGDPTTTATQVGSDMTDNTYTGSTMTHFGFFLNHSTLSAANITSNMGVFDDFKVTVNPVLTPSLSISSSTLTGFTYITGSGPSASQTYNLSGLNLTGYPGNIAVTGSANYEVSTDNFSFSSSVNVAYTSATLSSTPIYVRLKAGLGAANYDSETLGASGGGATASIVTCSGLVVNPPTTYTWQGADLGDWTVDANWTPTRTSPAINDILQFTDGTTKAITNVPTQTIAQMVVSNNTTVELQSSASAVLTIAGSTGVDFDVQSGSSLKIIQATNTIAISLNTGATGSVAGNITFTTAAHTLTSPDASGITFQSGSTFNEAAGCGNPFGTTNLNSVDFANGSRFIYQGGSNPFGATAPNSVVIWSTGSTFVHQSSGNPALANRTYANFELDQTGVNFGSASPVTMDNLTVISGNWGMNFRADFNIKGNVNVASGATLRFEPTSAGTVIFSGSSPQAFTNNGTFINGSFSTFSVTNASPLVFNNNSGAALSSSGSIAATLNNLGTLYPGGNAVVGTFDLTGSSINLGGTLSMDVTNLSTFDQVTASSASTLDVTGLALNVSQDPAFIPVDKDSVILITATSGTVTGPVASYTLPSGWYLVYSPNRISMKFDLATTLSEKKKDRWIAVSGKDVILKSDLDQPFMVNLITGQTVKTGVLRSENQRITLSNGLYIVSVGNQKMKVVIK
ncbi:MAG: DUF6383 domain-containing protein [Bacteroidales bacterium]|nr:DUF6383 domain-containing protein [Bacteroidales bacterium]